MKINRLVLNNFGLYCNRIEFALSPSMSPKDKKNIVLFGGLNGAGKTTMFDAIKLCLYGKEIFPRMSVTGYEDYLKAKIHHSKSLLIQPNHASVGLEFEYSHFGEVSVYYIERYWEVHGKKTTESLSIIKNNEKLKEVRADSWQEFIKQLIPPGLSQLFFFDGEKIQKMLENNSNEEFMNSSKMLLGLDIIERLEADLKIYRKKNLKNLSSEKLKKEIDQLESQKNSIEKKQNKIRESLAKIENGILKTEDDISKYKGKIAAQGDDFLKRKNSLTKDRGVIEKELETIKERMRSIAADLLPLSIASSYLEKLKTQINSEKEQHSNRIAEGKLIEKKEVLLEKLRSQNLLDGLDDGMKCKIDHVLKKEIDSLFSTERKADIKELFGFSPSQAERLLLSIEHSAVGLPKELFTLSSEYEKKYRALQNIVGDLKKVPNEEFVKPMYEKLNEINVNLGQMLNEKQHMENDVATLEREKEEIVRKIDKLTKHIEENEKETAKLKLSQKAERVLTIYKHELVMKKVDAFRREFLAIFRELHRKKDLIDQIEIDPATFKVTLYDSKKATITKESLSAGEQEIYAISLITALARASGQNLPFIIDMPLGRLDTVHRDKIIEHFFPNASHQVIIFSTNTEIDKHYFELLKPNLSHSYNLKYDHQHGRTYKEEGYFWN